MNSFELFDKLAKIAKWPWVSFVAAIGVGFLSAVVVTTAISFLYEPDKKLGGQTVPQVSINLPPDTQSITQNDVSTILKRNIFNIEGKVPEDEEAKQEETPAYSGNEAIKSKLPLVLHGTIYGGDPYSGLAMIEDTNRKSISSFMVGDSLGHSAKIAEIWREKVIIDLGDHKEYIELERKELAIRARKKTKAGPKADAKPQYASEPPPDTYKEEGFERAGTEIVVSNDFRRKLLTVDFAKVLQDAKAEPNFAGGELNGFKLNRIRTDSIYEKAGLQNNDIVKEVNGVPLTDTAQAIKLLNSLRGENEIEVRIERDGKPVTLNLQVR